MLCIGHQTLHGLAYVGKEKKALFIKLLREFFGNISGIRYAEAFKSFEKRKDKPTVIGVAGGNHERDKAA